MADQKSTEFVKLSKKDMRAMKGGRFMTRGPNGVLVWAHFAYDGETLFIVYDGAVNNLA